MKLAELFTIFCNLQHQIAKSAIFAGLSQMRPDHFILLASVHELELRIAGILAKGGQEVDLASLSLMPVTIEYLEKERLEKTIPQQHSNCNHPECPLCDGINVECEHKPSADTKPVEPLLDEVEPGDIEVSDLNPAVPPIEAVQSVPVEPPNKGAHSSLHIHHGWE